MHDKSILIAVGGNSLIRDGQHITVEDQYQAVCETAARIADIIQSGYRTVITHGNGPQVGFILHRSDLANRIEHMHPVPLVSCDADTQGAIGYQIQQAMDNEFIKREMNVRAVTLVTQVLVDGNDPAFMRPAKPIGGFMTESEYKMISGSNPDWTFMEDSGRGYRRTVASPMPREIIELDAASVLIENGYTVIAAGGGGIPVKMQDGVLKGVDAVIDKDRVSALMAVQLKTDILMISTGVRNAAVNFNKPDEMPITDTDLKTIKKHLEDRQFAEGSMRPKIEAAVYFLENGGKEVIITDPENLADALFHNTGTHIRSGVLNEKGQSY